MSNSSQQCPSSWREYTSSNIKVCGRANSQFGSCSFTSFPIPGGPYSRVCGRVIGYQVGSPDAFRNYMRKDSINFDGVNITYGTRHHHIWSYVAGWSESSQLDSCPCSKQQEAYLNRSLEIDIMVNQAIQQRLM